MGGFCSPLQADLWMSVELPGLGNNLSKPGVMTKNVPRWASGMWVGLSLFPGKCGHSRFKPFLYINTSCSSTDLWGRWSDCWSVVEQCVPALGLESPHAVVTSFFSAEVHWNMACTCGQLLCGGHCTHLTEPFVLVTLHIRPTAWAQGTRVHGERVLRVTSKDLLCHCPLAQAIYAAELPAGGEHLATWLPQGTSCRQAGASGGNQSLTSCVILVSLIL